MEAMVLCGNVDDTPRRNAGLHHHNQSQRLLSKHCTCIRNLDYAPSFGSHTDLVLFVQLLGPPAESIPLDLQGQRHRRDTAQCALAALRDLVHHKSPPGGRRLWMVFGHNAVGTILECLLYYRRCWRHILGPAGMHDHAPSQQKCEKNREILSTTTHERHQPILEVDPYNRWPQYVRGVCWPVAAMEYFHH